MYWKMPFNLNLKSIIDTGFGPLYQNLADRKADT